MRIVGHPIIWMTRKTNTFTNCVHHKVEPLAAGSSVWRTTTCFPPVWGKLHLFTKLSDKARHSSGVVEPEQTSRTTTEMVWFCTRHSYCMSCPGATCTWFFAWWCENQLFVAAHRTYRGIKLLNARSSFQFVETKVMVLTHTLLLLLFLLFYPLFILFCICWSVKLNWCLFQTRCSSMLSSWRITNNWRWSRKGTLVIPFLKMHVVRS